MTYLNGFQHEQLLRGVNPARVHNLKGMSYMEAYDIRAHLNRVFGFARWSADVMSMELVFERFHKNSKGNDAVSVGYRAGLTLSVSAPDGELLATYTEYAAGSSSGFPLSKQADAHDMAIKTSESQALKRAAINLGDQFGLSLYQNGSRNPIVMQTLDVQKVEEDVSQDVPEVVPEEESQTSVSVGESVGAWTPSQDWVTLMGSATTGKEKNVIWHQAIDDGADQAFLDALKAAGNG